MFGYYSKLLGRLGGISGRGHTIWASLVAQTVKNLPAMRDSKESARNAGDLGSIPGSGRSPGEEKGYSLQFSCLENSMDRGGVWWATFHGVTKSQTRLRN